MNAKEPLMRYRNYEEDITNRSIYSCDGTSIKKISKEKNLFIRLYGVRYISGMSFIRGQNLEQRSIVCRCKRETASKDLTSQLSKRHTVAD
jgi:hypothetical protein